MMQETLFYVNWQESFNIALELTISYAEWVEMNF